MPIEGDAVDEVRSQALAASDEPRVLEALSVEPVRRARRERAWRWYAASAVPLTVIYLWLPSDDAKLLVWPIIGWSSVVAILLGVRIHRPQSRGAWWMLAAGVATFIVGDNTYSFLSIVAHSPAPFPSVVDVIYLAMYPLLIAGLLILVRRRSGGQDRTGAIDASILAGSIGLLSWVFLIAPYVDTADLGVFARLTSMAYPIGDVALLATALRLAVGRGRRPVAFWLLAGCLLPLLVSDSLYGYMNLMGTWHEHNPVDIGWIVFYMGWGAAALHPSMTQLSLPTERPRRLNTMRLCMVGVAVLVPPTVLFVEGVRGSVTNAVAIALDGALLLVLVLLRVAGLVEEAAVTKVEGQFRTLVHDATDVVVALDDSGRIIYSTPSTERLFGLDQYALQLLVLADLLDEADGQRLVLMLSNRTTVGTLEWRIRRGDDEWRDLEVTVADMRDMSNRARIVLTMRDVTERKQLDDELRRQALHDSLTGLSNRTLFADRVEQAMAVASDDHGSVTVLLLDLDDFKEINDSLGHAAGDELLIEVAARLIAALPIGTTIGRLGGDEFAVLLADGSDEQLSFATLRIQAALHAPLVRGTDQLSMHASIGTTLGSASTHTADDVLREADLAMYVAKRDGKNRSARYHPSMRDDAANRLGLIGELRQAITDNDLVVFYQPIVDARTGSCRGAEALVRWQHPNRGLIGPSTFISIAETSGLVVPLGRWVLEDACRTTQKWKDAGLVDDAFYVSVNLSARHLQHRNVLHDITAALGSSGLDPSALVLEVTETGLIEDLNPAGSTLAMLKRLGVRIAVDDFGTGYSSLAYLSSFPIDILKIDKSFIDQLTVSDDGARMVRAVVGLAATLDLIAIAEGVETQAQADQLHILGCPLIQGFLFAKPMSAENMAIQLRHRRVAWLATSVAT